VRQLTLTGDGALEWEDVADPVLEDGADVLVRPLAVATCDLDTMMVRGDTPFGGPLPIGHECVAEVVDAGDAEGVGRGGLVSVPFQISCGECGRCRRGQTGNCESVPWQSAYGLPPYGPQWGGFLSDLVRVPFAERMLVPIPEGVDPVSVASLSDNIVDGWRTVGPFLAERPDSSVLVVAGAGPGSIALYAAGIAVALGSPRVAYVDSDERRLEIARNLGAEPIPYEPGDRPGSFDVTVDASADPDRLRLALRCTTADGVCVSTGIYFSNDVSLPLFEAYAKGVTFHTGRVHARPAIPPVLDLVASGRLHPELVTTRVVGWEEAPEALAEADFVKLVFARQAG
jgi:threonine dehydrogenase-like Zn-dependent dehydrogenase